MQSNTAFKDVITYTGPEGKDMELVPILQVYRTKDPSDVICVTYNSQTHSGLTAGFHNKELGRSLWKTISGMLKECEDFDKNN